jgi:LmbE family N-acetylglucosaminyl deacetylase
VSPVLALVVAHPDDDTFGSAGTVALHADDPSFRFVLLHATRGEAGEIADPALATPETLGAVREEEDRRSWIALGREPDRHEWLGYPDHGLADVDRAELVDRIAAILREETPDVVVTFGPDGVTGHPDHVAVGAAATAAFHRLREEGVPGFLRLIHTVIPQRMIDAWNRELVAAGEEPMDSAQMYVPGGVPDETVNLEVDTTRVVDRVIAAIAEHRTQAGGIGDWSDEQLRRTLSREHGVVAWPPRMAGAPLLTDVFESLDGSRAPRA